MEEYGSPEDVEAMLENIAYRYTLSTNDLVVLMDEEIVRKKMTLEPFVEGDKFDAAMDKVMAVLRQYAIVSNGRMGIGFTDTDDLIAFKNAMYMAAKEDFLQ